MVGPAEIADAAWERISPLLPENGKPGGRWRDHRAVLNGILWRLRTGAPGATCPPATDPGKPATTASSAGSATGPGRGCSPTCRPRATRWAS
jgi:transposase